MAFAGDAVVLGLKGCRLTVVIEEDRILLRPAREQPFGKAGKKDHFVGAAPSLGDAADEDPSIAGLAGIVAQEAQPFGQRQVDFVQIDGTDGLHRAEFVEDAPDGFGALDGHPRKGVQSVEPFSPKGFLRQRVEFGNQRQGETGERAQTVDLPLRELGARGVFAFKRG